MNESLDPEATKAWLHKMMYDDPAVGEMFFSLKKGLPHSVIVDLEERARGFLLQQGYPPYMVATAKVDIWIDSSGLPVSGPDLKIEISMKSDEPRIEVEFKFDT